MALVFFILLLGVSSCQGLPERYKTLTLKDKKDSETRYKPVILIHGLFGKNTSLIELEEFIKKKHPGTNVYNMHLFTGPNSFNSLWKQVKGFYDAIVPLMNQSTDGINIVAFSQGGLIARGIVQTKNDHRVHNLISLSSPMAGHYGDAYLVDMGITKETAYQLVYQNKFFKSYSVAQFWNDPHRREKYLKNCEFLPYINNEIEGKEKKEYKENFERLNKLVLIGGPDDGVVTPWQSSHFSFYDKNENVVDFRDRDIYTKNLFGLKTLDLDNKIQLYTVEGVGHFDWPKKDDVLSKYVLPWLD